MDDKNKCIAEELGVFINHDFTENTPKFKLKRFNPKFKILREFILTSISALSELKSQLFAEFDDCSKSQVVALDALSSTGVCGIQWKKRLSKTVHVTLADSDDLNIISQNATANSLSCTEVKLSEINKVPQENKVQGPEEIFTCQADAKAIMTLDAYNFICLNATKNITTYFEPAMNSLTNNGLLCCLCSDVSLFARSPHVVQRLYGANLVKTEYLKELSARIIIANLARCAARYNKGIAVQFVVSHGDDLLLCVKVKRGHAVADDSVAHIGQLLHCRLCEQRNFLPQQLAPLDEPYSFLQCDCKNKNPGKTAVVLGPLWKGPIFQRDFLQMLVKHGQKLQNSAKFVEIVNLLLAESSCSNQITSITLVTSSQDTLSEQSIQQDHKTEETLKDPREDEQLNINNSSRLPSPAVTLPLKRKAESPQDENSSVKKSQTNEGLQIQSSTVTNTSKSETPQDVPFYYNICKFRRTNIPKLDKLVTILHCQGHKASRTHFDHSAIRTSASVAEFLRTLS
ncbi:TRMT1-like protein [Biomphalaria glabrata]|uniref:tRNA (guanine(26)-N(2))-dimethyltransferase n=1 Tax=Biomphalaria glabrata TaxID=6526 RepID=A0A9W3AH44_BIOGL|nr:TRMT1-like protein [Biomphalaria glabrata]